jgi:hypothetical protein
MQLGLQQDSSRSLQQHFKLQTFTSTMISQRNALTLLMEMPQGILTVLAGMSSLVTRWQCQLQTDPTQCLSTTILSTLLLTQRNANPSMALLQDTIGFGTTSVVRTFRLISPHTQTSFSQMAILTHGALAESTPQSRTTTTSLSFLSQEQLTTWNSDHQTHLTPRVLLMQEHRS